MYADSIIATGWPNTFGRMLGRIAVAAILLARLAAPSLAFAQPAPTPTQEAPKQVEASLSHSVAKAFTLKLASFAMGAVVFSAGTGSVAEGTVLSAINAAITFVVLTANDYAWDLYWPNTNVSANNMNFGAWTSASRNTAKYLTLKPMVTAVNLSLLYWWTGSAVATAATGTAAFFALPLSFYINNTLWDWYDWHRVRK